MPPVSIGLRSRREAIVWLASRQISFITVTGSLFPDRREKWPPGLELIVSLRKSWERRQWLQMRACVTFREYNEIQNTCYLCLANLAGGAA